MLTDAVHSMTLQQKLDELREGSSQRRQPGLTLNIAANVLSNHASSLSDVERYAIVEQALIASLDCGNITYAETLLKQLVKKFGTKSIRVARLEGMLSEATGKTEKAQAIYAKILLENPHDSFVPKRLCAIAKGNGRLLEAIDALEKKPVYEAKGATGDASETYTFLDLHNTDVSAIRELICLHWAVGKLPRALHYANEAVLLDPCNSAAYTRAAEMAYANGKLDHAATAYAHSLRLNPGANNLRALYGLWLVAVESVRGAKGSSSRRGGDAAGSSGGSDGAVTTVQRSKQLGAFAVAKLRTLYQSAGGTTLKYLDMLLQRYNGPVERD